jgi:hypothetical protein
MFRGRSDVVFVDDDEKEIRRSVGFSPDMFLGTEFTALKLFCNKKGVHQRHLNAVFKRYLDNEHLHVRQFRVRTLDTKDSFSDKSKLIQEIAEIFIPTIFMKEYRGLQEGHSMEEVTFPRFMIMSYLFCMQPMPDLIFDFISILRQRFDLKLTAVIFAHNLEQIAEVLAEEIKPSATKKYFFHLLKSTKKESEVSVEEILQMGIKYPILFYQLKRFRKHFRRLVLGDKFWAGRKLLKSKFADDMDLPKGYDADFANEKLATRATCRILLRDVLWHVENDYDIELTATFYSPLTEIDDDDCYVLKTTLGYQLARSLILESELPYPTEGHEFLNKSFIYEGPGEERIRDHKSRQDFLYDVAVGKRAWVMKYLSFDGLDTVLKEVTHENASHMAFEQATTDDGTGNETS